jgi:hypothetical protein
MRKFITLAALAICGQSAWAEIVYKVQGEAWTEIGRIGKISDSLQAAIAPPNNVINVGKTWMHSVGAQATVHADLGDNWDGAFGFGAYQVAHPQATYKGSNQPKFLSISMFQNFVTQARITFYSQNKDSQGLHLTFGNYAYQYNPDVQNLGAYLLRGAVYPQILVGGFEDFSVDSTKANLLGAHLHYGIGNLNLDLLLNNERDIPPTFDWSVAAVAKYKALDAIEFGGGVNLYRILPSNSDLTEPGRLKNIGEISKYVEFDTTVTPAGPSIDTIYFSHQGIKLMGMFSIDLKPFLGMRDMAAPDMKLYGEAAVIGIKNYGKTYDKIGERIPMMLGFNFPTFGILDRLSLEVEYFKNRYRNDMAMLGNQRNVADWTLQAHPLPSPGPVRYSDYGIDQGQWVNNQGDTVKILGTPQDKENLHSDDFKWSLNLEKNIQSNIRFTAQIANDHYRPKAVATNFIVQAGGTAEAFTAASDWYFMLRLGYFF